MLPHKNTPRSAFAKFPALLLFTLALTCVHSQARVIKKRETVAPTLLHHSDNDTVGNMFPSSTNSLNSVAALSTRLLPAEKKSNTPLDKVDVEEASKNSDESENLENKMALEDARKVAYSVEEDKSMFASKEDSDDEKSDLKIEPLTPMPPNKSEQNSSTPLVVSEVGTESTSSRIEAIANHHIFSHSNVQDIKQPAKAQSANDNKISDALDQQEFNVKPKVEVGVVTNALPILESSSPTLVALPITPNPRAQTAKTDFARSMLHSEESDDDFQWETTTMPLEPIAIKLHNPIQIVTMKPTTNELLKSEVTTTTTKTTAASSLAHPNDVEVRSDAITTTTSNSNAITSNELFGADSTPVQRSSMASTEKRAKFINDNSTNTNKLQLPDAAAAWTLAGMKSVAMQHQAANVSTLERAPNESAGNSEKNLLDWTQIMMAMSGTEDPKTFDNLIDTSTDASTKQKLATQNAKGTNDIPRDTTVPATIEANYMPAATIAIDSKSNWTEEALAPTQKVNDAAPIENATILPNVDANTIWNSEFPTTTTASVAAAASNDVALSIGNATGGVLSPTLLDKSTDNSGTTTTSSGNSKETSTEHIVVMSPGTTTTTEYALTPSATSDAQNNSSHSVLEVATALSVPSTVKSILDLPEAETTSLPKATTQQSVEADKAAKYTTETTTVPDKHLGTTTTTTTTTTTSEQSSPPPATSAVSTETNSSSYFNEHANTRDDDSDSSNNNTNAFNTTLEHNSSETSTLSTTIASVVNTTFAIEQGNTTIVSKEEENETFEKIITTTTITTPRTKTTTITEPLATILATATTETHNQNGNEVDLDIGTEQIDKTSSLSTTETTTTTTTIKNNSYSNAKEEEAATATTSSDKNLLITTTTATAATPIHQELPTLATESVSALFNETAEAEEEERRHHNETTTHAVPNTPTTTTIASTSIDDSIGLEKPQPHETESSIETNAIDSAEKLKITEGTTARGITNTTTTTPQISINEDENNEDMLLPEQQGMTTSTAAPTIITTSKIPTSVEIITTIPVTTTTTTEAPLISLLDDISTTTTTTTTTVSPQTPPPPIGTTATENTDQRTTTADPLPVATVSEPTTKDITTTTTSTTTMATTLTSLLPKLLESSSSPVPNLAQNIFYGANLSNNNSNNRKNADGGETDVNVIIAISVSIIGIIALILLVAFLYVMRKRQKQNSSFNRCRPVGLDAYSLDNVSIYNSVRRKGATRASKRSYGNVAFDDPSLKHHLLGATELSKFLDRRMSIFEEFRDVPQITARADEVPPGCEDKNRYANVIPLPETRVILQQQNDDEKTEYINANYVRGPKDAPNYYIACQAPLDSTVADFWRMIWEQQSRVIIQATDLIENGIEKCAEYLPPSVTIDNHVTYGDFQITLKNREVKDKYAISTILLKHIVENEKRELTHYWYKWPETGVPQEEAPIIAMLLEARSSLKSYAIEQANELKEKSSTLTIKSDATVNPMGKEVTLSVTSLENEQKDSISASGSHNGEINGNVSTDKLKAAARNQGPLTVHCSPGTGRTGTIIGCDMAIRCLETPKRNVDIPQIVYYIRRGRASAVQTKEQYEFIYKVANMYATKITNLSNDN